MNGDIQTYHNDLSESDAMICDQLRQIINESLPDATSKVWHGHPVWFLDNNPIVGYSKLKGDVRLMFWSGQSFDEPSLISEGSFKAAQVRYTDVAQINKSDVQRYLQKSTIIQWDYKNIVKNRGVLNRLK
ncbi:MAG: DUF1801 domain-containing protein [Chloroflexi bacterium]|nr:MAG: DUF1801 domain-containing protein [Chloroflexota bacterium]